MTLTVIQALPALDHGGVERGTVDVARELVGRGHRSIVISAGGRLVQELTGTGSEHICLGIGNKSPLSLRHIPALRQIMRSREASLLHVRSRFPGWLAYLAWRGMNRARRPRFVTSVHGPYTVTPYSKVMTYGEQVIAISEFIRDYILTNYPNTDPARITVIPRGVSADKFPYNYQPPAPWRRHWFEQHPVLRGKFLITLPARITRWKGQEDFLQIISSLKHDGIDVHGIMVGGPDPGRQAFFNEIKSRAVAMKLHSDISFTGHRDDVREIMSLSGMVLSLAREPEGFGRTALEALSMGVPVIAYDHGGAREVLQAIFPEGLVAANNPGAVIRQLKKYCQKRPVVPNKNPFTLQRMLDSTISLYEKMVT
ncbi:MAG: glycosyltransferase family 4 protein [Gammaproteobacteria bacterium]